MVGLVLSVRFKSLCISQVGILSWGNLIYTNSHIDFSVRIVGFVVFSVFSKVTLFLGLP